jgi:hypothetical protein
MMIEDAIQEGKVKAKYFIRNMASDQNGETINVSANGVCFEIATNDMDVFSPGTIIPLQIYAVTTTPDSTERKLSLREKISYQELYSENPDHENNMGIAVEFKEKLDIQVV